jgi:sirohydrochlorin cobaltochelatase
MRSGVFLFWKDNCPDLILPIFQTGVFMKRYVSIFALFVAVLIMMMSSSTATAGHGHAKDTKKGILLVAFGTSVPQARRSFDHIAERAANDFPSVPVRWAYTSSIIRKKLAKQGTLTDSVEMALVKMMEEGFTHVAVQSLHTIRGEEYDDLAKTVQAFQYLPEGFEKIAVGAPLLSTEEDMKRVSEAILVNIPSKRGKKDAVVLMGHGTPHPSNAFYAALLFHLQLKDPLVFMGTVEGYPDLDLVTSMLKGKDVRTAWLIPFMSVAGDHAMNDMAGPEEDSWKSKLEKEGISCKPVMKGTAEYDNMVDIWMDHLKAAMAHL